ncbi:MAG: hypothetical protein K0U39_04350 [Alphaproteobacteria bacterium]|nr:hypothetical protein [Alphaproteobacteria bacterium]
MEQSRFERSQYQRFFVTKNSLAVTSNVMKSNKKPVSEIPIALAFDKNLVDICTRID